MCKKFIFILIILFTVSACDNLNETREDILLDFVNHENHEIIVFIDDNQLLEPNGMAFDGEYIYVVDAGHHAVFKYDLQGNYVGLLGNGDLEFDLPSAIAISPVDGSIFVANERGKIQMIQDGVNVEEFSMEYIEDYWRILSIEVDDEHSLYVSVLSIAEIPMKIHVFNNQGVRTEIGEKHIGFLGRGENNEILFAQKFEVIDEETIGSGYTNFFGQIIDHELVSIAQLPAHYTPTAIFSRDNRIYLFSYGFHQLHAFDFYGNYIETIYEYEVGPENPKTGMSYVIAFGSDSFLISDSENGIIYKIRPVE